MSQKYLPLFFFLMTGSACGDDKLRTLQRSYEAMLDPVRALSQRAQETPAEAAQYQAQIAVTIESFINDTMQINAKG